MLIIDTNIWISYALTPGGAAGKCIRRVLEYNDYYFSEETFKELVDVLMRPKFDPYVSHAKRENVLHAIAANAQWAIDVAQVATECRDPKDNKFLDLALACEAQYIVTGDEDLLVLDPYHETRIVTISQLIEAFD